MLLQIDDIHVQYGHVEALKGISLTVHRGEVVTLIGANGAGKTTLLQAVSGILRPRQGTVFFNGQSILGLAPYVIARLGLSHVPERRRLFGPLSVMDNLMLGSYSLPRTERNKILPTALGNAFESFPILRTRLRDRAETLSGGQQQMLALARGLMSQPKLLLLDEPSLGLAPLVVKEIMAIVAQLRERGATILLVEQNARAALRVADRGYVLDRGEVILSGAAAELTANPLIQATYLGARGAKSLT